MNKKAGLTTSTIILVVVFIIGLYFGYKNFNQKDKIVDLEEENEQLKGKYAELEKQKDSITKGFKCPEGYYITTQPRTIPPSDDSFVFYCRIDKEWEDFKDCNNISDCPKNYSCMSRINRENFRCVPQTGYPMDCWCLPNEECVCA